MLKKRAGDVGSHTGLIELQAFVLWQKQTPELCHTAINATKGVSTVDIGPIIYVKLDRFTIPDQVFLPPPRFVCVVTQDELSATLSEIGREEPPILPLPIRDPPPKTSRKLFIPYVRYKSELPVNMMERILSISRPALALVRRRQ
jgi:hypothetical protein